MLGTGLISRLRTASAGDARCGATGALLLALALVLAGCGAHTHTAGSYRAAVHRAAVHPAAARRILRQTLPPDSRPDAIAFGYGTGWVTNWNGDDVWRIDLPSGQLLGPPIQVGGQPDAIAIGAGSVWVANSTDDTVIRIDPRTDHVVGPPIHVGSDPVGIAVGGGSVWVANDFDDTLDRLDARTGRMIGPPIKLHLDAWSISVSRGVVWVASLTAGTLSRIDARSGRVLGTPVALGAPGLSVAGSPAGAWAPTAIGAVRYDSRTARITAVVPVAQPRLVAVAGSSLWVTTGKMLLRCDLATGRLTSAYSLRAFADAIAVGGGSVWLAHKDANQITRIDAQSGRVLMGPAAPAPPPVLHERVVGA